MSIVITNIETIRSKSELCRYSVRINNDPPVAFFLHYRGRGLGECLRLASEAVKRIEESEVKEPTNV